MKSSIRIVVACGGGIFTTTVVTDEIKTILRKEKIQHVITPAKITEVPNIMGADLIVVTGKTSECNKDGAPVLMGLSLFTGVGAEEFTETLLKTIRDLMNE